jgi:hypothetical protein
VPQQQKFKTNDRVSVHLPDGKRRTGTVIEVYALDTKWRYVVKFDSDASEGVFFDFELVLFPHS